MKSPLDIVLPVLSREGLVVGFDTSLLPDWWKLSIFIHVDARVFLLYIFIHALTFLPQTVFCGS
jgi:hypothetical protein